MTTTSTPARKTYVPGLLIAGIGCIVLNLFSAPVRPTLYKTRPSVLGVTAGLKWGLWQQSLLPTPPLKHPVRTWLKTTVSGRHIIKKPISLFRTPKAAAFRANGLDFTFLHRFGWCCASQKNTEPKAIVVHSTEGETEASAFQIFDRNTGNQYLGGIWTHFAVGPEGKIYQYGPLNRISKGQAGLDDIGMGIEIVGHASLWSTNGTQTRTGSIIERYKNNDTRQLDSVADLIVTLRQLYAIPRKRVYSHEEVGNIRDLKGTYPDYHWLREHIRDGVYLGKVPTVDEKGEARQWYDFLAPYDREDPGKDVMSILR